MTTAPKEPAAREPRRRTRTIRVGAIVGVCLLANAALLAIAIGIGSRILLRPRCRDDSTRTDARTVAGAVEMYVAENPAGACPTIGQLYQEGFVNRSARTTDCRNRPFRIECDGTDITVRAAGPDGEHGTADDIE